MNRGEVYRTEDRVAERGGKPGFYVVVSRQFVAANSDISTVICAPLYSEILGIATEVVVGPDDGLPRRCAVRCDFLALLFKQRLTQFVCTLPPRTLRALERALATSLDLPSPVG